MRYDLAEESWIPVADMSGEVAHVGLRDALVRAHEFRELRDPSPLVTAALHRLLLVVLHRAYDGPADAGDWASMWRAGRFDERRVGDHLARWRDRFDLFGAEHPFYQIAGFDVTSESDRLPVAQLAQELAGGNNSTLFDHTSDSSPAVWDAAVCARRLVANQAFALGGGVSPTTQMFGRHPNRSHAPLVGGVTVLLTGDTLFQALMLNLLLYGEHGTYPVRKSEADVPAWERDEPRPPGEYTPEGWLDLLTWQSRCVRLFPEDGGIRRMAYAQGLSLNAESRPRDPMWFYRLDAKDEARYHAVRLDPDRALWRSADSLFAFSAEGDSRTQRRPRSFVQVRDMNRRGLFGQRSRWRCSLIGVANDKAKLLFWAHDGLPVPARLLDDEDAVSIVRESIRVAEDVGKGLYTSLFHLAMALLPPKSKTEDIGRFVASLDGEPRYWAALDLPFRAFVETLAENQEEALVAWCDTVRRAAWDAFDSATDALGGSPRELRARVEAARILGGRLKEAIPQREEEPHEQPA